MTPLRTKMQDAMKLAGLADKTQKAYLLAVRRLAKHYNRSPDKITEQEVHQFFLQLIDDKVARGTFKKLRFGIQFFYEQVLDYDWPLFTKKRSASPSNSVCLRCSVTTMSICFFPI